jgi:hypothetical protein
MDPTDSTYPKTSSNGRAKSLYILGVVLIIAIFLGGYLTGKSTFKMATSPTSAVVEKNILDNPILQTISASINGTVVNYKDNNLSIISSIGSADFPLSSQFRLFRANTNQVASGSAAISAIETNKPALIILNYNRQIHKFEVTNINYNVGTNIIRSTATSSSKLQPK